MVLYHATYGDNALNGISFVNVMHDLSEGSDSDFQ